MPLKLQNFLKVFNFFQSLFDFLNDALIGGHNTKNMKTKNMRREYKE